jgi:hypothetical protein
MSMEMLFTSLVQVVSTVVGVYLAARAAHRNTVNLETSRALRDNYYMRRALLDEVRDNLAAIESWAANIERALRNTVHADYFLPTDSWVTYWSDKNGCERGNVAPDEIKMKTYVWEAMKQQSTTFQLPPDMLSAVRRFYDNMEKNDKDMRSKTWKAGPAAKAITGDTMRMRTELVPLFEKNTARLRAKLEAASVAMEE